MNRRTVISWAIEFLCVTAIAIVLSDATSLKKWWIALPIAIIVIVKLSEYLHYQRLAIEIIRYQLQILITLLPTNGSKIRCTYHRPIHHWFLDRKELEQVFDYIPDGGGGGRRFPVEKGIIGKVYITKAPRVENFASDGEYRSRMVNEYNYTTTEVMARSADRRSYLCYPIVDESHMVLGLLYFDSDTPHTFTHEDLNPRWRTIREAGEVIRGNILAGS